MGKKLLFLVNVDWFFLSHRLPIALEAIEKGYEVYVATGITTRQKELESYGLIVKPIPLNRGKSSVLTELQSFKAIYKILKEVDPNITHLVTVKPVLYGGLAARLTRTRNIVVAISGLGYIFTSKSRVATFRRRVISLLYRLVLSQDHIRVIIQNSSDRDILVKIARLRSQKTELIPGSGIDLKKFHYVEETASIPRVIMASRLLSDKGVFDFAEAAKLLKHRNVTTDFYLVGEIDPDSPTSLSSHELENLGRQNYIELVGRTSNVSTLFSQSHIVVHPSYYGEGLPKVLIEAAACGRAVVTTDVPGCRDAIIPNVTGLLVPARNSQLLADAIEKLIIDGDLRRKMGQAGRKLAEDRFDIKQVVDKHLAIYDELLAEQ